MLLLATFSVAATSVATSVTTAIAAATATAETTATATSATTAEATATAATRCSGLGHTEVQSDGSSFNFLAYKSCDGLGCVSGRGELDVGEASGTFSLSILGNTDGLDGTALLEEVPDGLFGGAETKVAAEDSVCLTSGGTTGDSRCGGGLREHNLNVAAVKSGTVHGGHGLSCLLVGAELDERASLVVKVSALGQSSVNLEQLANGLFPSFGADVAHHKLSFASILGGDVNVTHFSSGCLLLLGGGFLAL